MWEVKDLVRTRGATFSLRGVLGRRNKRPEEVVEADTITAFRRHSGRYIEERFRGVWDNAG